MSFYSSLEAVANDDVRVLSDPFQVVSDPGETAWRAESAAENSVEGCDTDLSGDSIGVLNRQWAAYKDFKKLIF